MINIKLHYYKSQKWFYVVIATVLLLSRIYGSKARNYSTLLLLSYNDVIFFIISIHPLWATALNKIILSYLILSYLILSDLILSYLIL